MEENKLIKNKRIAPWAIPFRMLFRFINEKLFREPTIRQVNIRGIKYLVWANEDIGKKLIVLRSFEKNETDAFKKLIHSGDVCVDVGGNVGYFSLNFAKLCGNDGLVHTFEPIKQNAILIELANILNKFRNISVYRAALSDSEGEITLTVPELDGAYAYIQNSENGKPGEKVQCLTLDSFADQNGINRIDIIKIDVEGAEEKVLRGAINVLSDKSRRPRVIMVELVNDFLNRFDSSIDNVLEYLNNFGYEPFYAGSGGKLITYTKADHDYIFNVFFIQKGHTQE